MRNIKAGVRTLLFLTTVYLLLAGVLIGVVAFIYEFSLTHMMLSVGIGLVFWTLFEYATHRFLFHSPSVLSGFRRKFIHARHHANTKDLRLMVARPLFTMTISFPILVSIWVSPFGNGYFFAVTLGFTLGYIYYEWVHFAIHEQEILSQFPLFRWQRVNHLRHHSDPRAGYYGVTSPLWDWIFRMR